MTPSLILTVRHVVTEALDANGPRPPEAFPLATRTSCRVRTLAASKIDRFTDAAVVWWSTDDDVALIATIEGTGLA